MSVYIWQIPLGVQMDVGLTIYLSPRLGAFATILVLFPCEEQQVNQKWKTMLTLQSSSLVYRIITWTQTKLLLF